MHRRLPATRRVALYSHDTQGLGHVRRNALIAAALVADHPDTEVLLLTGTPEATSLPLPPRTEVVTVPGLRKDDLGVYHPRVLSAPLEGVIAIRARVIEAALMAFAPDLLIVDKVARGVLGELDGTLRRVRQAHHTALVLGLRDVLDGTEATVREWEELQTTAVVCDLYDQIWVYGDPALFDPAVEYAWPAVIREKLVYTGYLARGRADHLSMQPAGAAAPSTPATPYVLGLVGGGQDGSRVARCFAGAVLPRGHRGLLVCGPYLATDVFAELRAVADHRGDLDVVDFVKYVPTLVGGAAATVSMGGYNSVCELLEAGRPALLVPRTTPRTEQAVRAERLHQAGVVDVADIATIETGGITRWLSEATARPGRRSTAVDLDGLARLPGIATSLLERRTAGQTLGGLTNAGV